MSKRDYEPFEGGGISWIYAFPWACCVACTRFRAIIIARKRVDGDRSTLGSGGGGYLLSSIQLIAAQELLPVSDSCNGYFILIFCRGQLARAEVRNWMGYLFNSSR